MGRARPRRGPRVGPAALLCLVVAGCVTEPAIPTGLADPVTTQEGVCGLLEADEVEVALNIPLASGGNRRGFDVRPIVPGMDMCAVGGGHAGAAWGLASGPAAERSLARYVKWHADHLRPVDVEGGERAVWDEALGTVVVLAGGEVVGVRVMAPSARDRQDGVIQAPSAAALDLAARALGRR